MKFQNVIRQLYNNVVGIIPTFEVGMKQSLHEFHLKGGIILEQHSSAQIGTTDFWGVPLAVPSKQGNIAVIPVDGVLAKGLHPVEKSMGFVDYNDLIDWIGKAADDSTVDAIMLAINSPGGSTLGMFELADVVEYATGKKPTMAYAENVMGSAAYIPFTPVEAIYASKSAVVGSIGIYSYFIDSSAFFENLGLKAEVIVNTGGIYKAAGIEGTSITDEQRAQIQREVDHTYAEAVKIVAMNRSVNPEFMKGQATYGQEAVEAGLIDDVATPMIAFRDLSALI